MISVTTKLRVRYQETDKMGIVYHSNYLVWFEIARTEFFRKMGVSYTKLEKEGYCLLVAEANCKYRAPAGYDDEIDIRAEITELKNSSLSFGYEVRKENTLIASGTTKHVLVDASGKIMRIPPVVGERLRSAPTLFKH